MTLLGLLLVPVVIALAGALIFRRTITLKEALVQVFFVGFVVTAGFFLTRTMSLRDTEHLHGRVRGKITESSTCCHCFRECEDQKSDGSCRREKVVCEHSRDYQWGLDTTMGRLWLHRCEANPNAAPASWLAAKDGDAVTATHEYTNYLRADPDAPLRNEFPHAYLASVPAFPKVYDSYKVDPVVSDGATFPIAWQQAFRELNADLGGPLQVDVTVIVTREADPRYADAVAAKWLYGPKNSVNVVMGVSGSTITWARVVSYSRAPELRAALQEGLAGKSLSADIPGFVRNAIQTHYRRTPMAEAEYLLSAATPPKGWLIFLYAFGILGSLGCSYLMHKWD